MNYNRRNSSIQDRKLTDGLLIVNCYSLEKFTVHPRTRSIGLLLLEMLTEVKANMSADIADGWYRYQWHGRLATCQKR